MPQKNITTEHYHFFLTDEFSQWYPSKFKDERNIEFNCCEQWMMYSKAEMFGDLEIMKQVLETTDPADMKKLGRLIKNFDKEEWDSKAPTIVTIGNLMKFTQNAHLWEILSNTNNKTLVEAADYDSIWGIGLKAEQALLLPESEWKGQNNLGKALMEVRDILKLNPSLVDKPSLEDKKIFNFVDLKGQKIIRLSMKELSKELNCVCTDLQELLSNMPEEKLELKYEPFVKKTMVAYKDSLLLSLESALKSRTMYKFK